MSVSVNVNPVAVINSVNLVVSLGLLALGIVLIIYGFKIPDEKCTDDKNFLSTHNAASGNGGMTPPNKDCFQICSNRPCIFLLYKKDIC